MEKIFIFSSQLGLPLRLLFLFIIMTLLSVEALAQDTTLARIPQVELTPVDQREVMEHYINKIWTSKGWQIEIFDGAEARTKASALRFGQEILITTSPNQRYFTVAKPVTSSKGATTAYDVELRSMSNSVLAKGRLSSLGSDGEESHDEFVPSDDGLGIVHKANLVLSGRLHFVFFQRKNSTLIKRFEVDKTVFWNAKVIYEATQKMIVATFEGHITDTKLPKTHVQCYSSKGTLQWETALDSQHVKSELFISAFDGTIAFVSRNAQDERHKNLFLFRKNGTILRSLPVYRGGLYKQSYYRIIDGRQYFLSPSDGEFYYVIDPANGEIINRNTQGKEGSYVTGLVMFQQYIVTSYFTGNYQSGPGNTQEFAITERGLGVEDSHGAIAYIPLHLIGTPFLVATKAGLFIREQLGIGINERNKFYKIEIK
ncbi:MAG: hypothetical protein ACKVT2_20675 [Saprospiraceae bacterium]